MNNPAPDGEEELPPRANEVNPERWRSDLAPKEWVTSDVKEWVTSDVDVVTKHRLKYQGRIITFLFWLYGTVIVATMTIIFFEGFHFKGFSLSEKFLMWLGGITLGEIGGLLTLTWGALFRSES
jgi:hypothetical protein